MSEMSSDEGARVEEAAARWVARQDDAEGWSDTDELAFHGFLAAGTANRVEWLRLRRVWLRVGLIADTAKALDSRRSAPREGCQ